MSCVLDVLVLNTLIKFLVALDVFKSIEPPTRRLLVSTLGVGTLADGSAFVFWPTPENRPLELPPIPENRLATLNCALAWFVGQKTTTNGKRNTPKRYINPPFSGPNPRSRTGGYPKNGWWCQENNCRKSGKETGGFRLGSHQIEILHRHAAGTPN